ncbi:MAG: ABC transporter ATP-binding protein [Candidatus Limnocylindrales bacterium]
MTDRPAIEIQGLAKRFGSVEAVAGIDLEVASGSLFGFLGPNGAGKTTTIRMLVGLLWPTSGSAAILGRPVRPGTTDLHNVGALVERPAFYGYLSAIDNLRLFAAAHGATAQESAALIGPALERTGLGPVARRKVGGFSTGMRQRLGLALAILHRPRLVILDEPTNGLDPAGVVEVRAILGELARDGTTVFLSSHVLTEVEQLCDQVAILRHGRIVATGATAELLRGQGEILVRFDTNAESAAAIALLAQQGLGTSPAGPGQADTAAPATLVHVAPTEGSRVARLLGEAGLYPAELTVRRATLEAVFLELTRDDPEGAASETGAASESGRSS